MYAVIETGGKQYRVEVGSEIEVEYLEAEPGQTLELDRVLLVADGDDTTVGRPIVDAARVSASVVRQDRGDKVVVFKYRPKARSRVKHGHRQELTVLRVADIVYGDRSARQQAELAQSERERSEAAAAEEAAQRAAADRALADQLAQRRTAGESAGTEGAAGAEKAEARSKAEAGSTAEAGSKPARGSARTSSGASKPASTRARAPRTQAPAPEGESKSRSRGTGGTRKDS